MSLVKRVSSSAIVVLFLAAGSASADLSPVLVPLGSPEASCGVGSPSANPHATVAPHQSTTATSRADSFREALDLGVLAFHGYSTIDPVAPVFTHPLIETTDEVRSLPPLPGSATLFLSAMLSVGAWHVFKSASEWHFADLPDWYHANAPAKIGHTFVYDLCTADLPLCCFETPPAERPVFCNTWREHRSRLDSQSFLTCIQLRGPPFPA